MYQHVLCTQGNTTYFLGGRTVIRSHNFMPNRWRNNGRSDRLFSWAPKSLWTVTAAMKLEDFAPWKKSHDKPRQHIKTQRHYFAYRGLSSQSYGFSSSHAWMWEQNNKKGWALKNWCRWTVVLVMTLESPLDSKEIKPVNPKGNQLNIHWKDWCWSWSSNTLATWWEELTHSVLMLGKIEGRRSRGRQRMRWLYGITDSMDMSLSKGDVEGSLACCSPWGRKESDLTERLNSNRTVIQNK